MKNDQLSFVISLIICLFSLFCSGQSNGNCDTAIGLEYEDVISYEFETMNSDRQVGCWGGPINKHWFNIVGNGGVIKLDYSLNVGSLPVLFVLSGSCETFECLEAQHGLDQFYLETEPGINYMIIFTGSKVYGTPSDEPGGELYLRTTTFKENCIDSLPHVVTVDVNATLSAIDYINGCPVLTGSATFISGSTIELGRGFEVTNTAVFECIIDDCSVED